MTMPAYAHATDARWTQLIDDAIAGDAVACHFQPIIDLDQQVVVGYEALARFSHPDAEGVGPDVWFARASARGLQPELEAAVLRMALSRRSDMPPETFLAVNVAPDSLRHPLVSDVLSQIPDLTGLVIEITEHSAWEWADLEPVVSAVRARGALIAVDHAGAGYSGLQQILELRPSILKLDRDIVDGVATDEAKVALIEMIGLFAARVEAWVVAEGIESLADAKRLATMRVPLAQGYLFARPSPQFEDIDPGVSAQLAGFRDQAGETLHRLVQPVPTVTVEQGSVSRGDFQGSAWAVAVDGDRRPLGLVSPETSATGDVLAAVIVNAATPPAQVAQRVSLAPTTPGAPILVTDDAGRLLGIVTLRALLGDLSGLT